MFTDEMMFYGGLVLAAAVLVLGLICFCIYEIRKAGLSARLDAEYGEKVKESAAKGKQQSRSGTK